MSLTSALNAAQSGLAFSSRWAQTTSANISNANTPGYARRSPVTTTTGLGEPLVSGVTRAVDSSLDRMYRLEAARTGKQTALASSLSLHTAVLGATDSPDSMLSRLTDFRSAMGLLSVTPSDTALQRATLTDAQELARSLNRTHDGLSQARGAAESGITNDLIAINTKMSKLATLNQRIGQEREDSDLRLTLADQMNQVMDELAPLMNFTLKMLPTGQAEIYAPGGAMILSAKDAEPLSFDKSTGRLLAGDTDITPGVAGIRGLEEGSLAGHIEMRNVVVPKMQDQLDEVARALIEGFQDSDASIAPGDPGLFTDAGAAISGSFAPGLAGRIAVNLDVVPEQGGALWRIRDGMGAAFAGPSGDSTQINDYIAMLDAPTAFNSAVGLGETATLSGYAATLMANQQTTRAEAENARDQYSAGAETVQATRMGYMGVNVDDELQQLMAIEQAYGANSQVLRTVSSMIDTLLAAF